MMVDGMNSRWRLALESGASSMAATSDGGMIITSLMARYISIIPPPPAIMPPLSINNSFDQLATLPSPSLTVDINDTTLINHTESLRQWQSWRASIKHMQINTITPSGIRGIATLSPTSTVVYLTIEHGMAGLDMKTGNCRVLVGVNGGVGGHWDGESHTAQFHYPRGIVIYTPSPSSPTVSSNSVAFIADSVEGLIRRIDLSTLHVTTAAGIPLTGGRSWPQDGIGLESTFKRPSAMAYDSSQERLWIGDNSALRMMRVSSATTATYDVVTVPLSGDGAPSIDAKSDWAAILCWRSHLLFIADCERGTILKVDLRGM